MCTDGSILCYKHTHADESLLEMTSSLLTGKAKQEADIKHRILQLPTTEENKVVVLKHLANMQRVDINSVEYYKNQLFVDRCLAFPWHTYYNINTVMTHSDIKTFIHHLQTQLDTHIFGMHTVKNELINMVCKMITNPTSNRNNIALYGAAGVGKSKFIQVLANVLRIPLKVVSLGGVKDSAFFLGHAYVYVESGPGKIMQSIMDAGVSNPIVYFDELDKVSQTDTGKDVHSFLCYLTDPCQNTAFTDHYFYGMHFDLSKVMYVFTFNDISKIDSILLDRLNLIHIKTPNDNEICTILERHCIPEIVKNIGMKSHVRLLPSQLKTIVGTFKHTFDPATSSGIREYYRIVEKILLQVNTDILLGKRTDICDMINDTEFQQYLDIVHDSYPTMSMPQHTHMYS